jgi:release factor glutamine methyltransferase
MTLSESYKHMNNNSYQTTIESALSGTELELKNSMIKSARLDSQLILAHVIKKPRSWVLSHSDFVLSTKQIDQVKSLTILRQSNTPIAYLLKRKEFYRRTFLCDKRALVPRPESEQLISDILEILPKKPLSILDVGCGTGILGITTYLENPRWKITLSDISKDAIQLAKQNIESFNLSTKISIIEANLLPNNLYFDVVIANLPYVPTNLVDKLDIAKEPKLALFAGKDGLDVYRDLFKQLGDTKTKPTYLFIESLTEQQVELIKTGSSNKYSLLKQTDFTLSFRLKN